MILRVTDLKQWAIASASCINQHRMPGVGKQTYKMGEAKRRKTWSNNSNEADAARVRIRGCRSQIWCLLENEDLGLAANGPVVGDDTEAAIVEFKLTSGEVGHNHRLQLGGYSLLVETVLAKAVKCGSSTGFRMGGYFRFH